LGFLKGLAVCLLIQKPRGFFRNLLTNSQCPYKIKRDLKIKTDMEKSVLVFFLTYGISFEKFLRKGGTLSEIRIF
jgi:hypothetical protein